MRFLRHRQARTVKTTTRNPGHNPGLPASEPGPNTVRRRLPDKVIERTQVVRDKKHYYLFPESILHEFPEEKKREIYHAHPGLEKIVRAHPAEAARLFELFKQEQVKADALGKLRGEIQRELEENVPWPYGQTLKGPTAMDNREKTPGELQKEYIRGIETDRVLYQQSIETQRNYIQELIKTKPNIIRHPILRRRHWVEIRRAKKALKRTIELESIWESIVNRSEARLNKAFEGIATNMNSEKFSDKGIKLQQYHIRELNAAIEEYRSLKMAVGASVLGTPYIRKTKRQDKGYGFGLMPEFKLVFRKSAPKIKRILEEAQNEFDAKKEARAKAFLERAAMEKQQ